MGRTIVEQILATHTEDAVSPGSMVELTIDARVARDFAGANVVGRMEEHALTVADPGRTFFTFDCNPTGSDQGYAANQHRCRLFARDHDVQVYDIDRGIGTHVAMEEGLAGPGQTLVSTDSHANIMGAVLALGQGMGDLDVAHAFAYGTVWFKVPPTVRVRLEGTPGPEVTPKDITLALMRHFGAHGLLGRAVELCGPAIKGLDLSGRITLASMATETGAIIFFPEPGPRTRAEFRSLSGLDLPWPQADSDAAYERDEVVDLKGLTPLVARPGHPEDVVPVSELEGSPIDSAFIGSCTNGRLEDLRAAARIMEGRRVAPGVVLKVVPATDRIWRQALKEGLIDIFKAAGALVSNAGCAGCAAGQVGQTGPGEREISTGNRNFAGKQGLGSVYLASPETTAASAVAGALVAADRLDAFLRERAAASRTGTGEVPTATSPPERKAAPAETVERPTVLEGRTWVLPTDSVDTDMIYHNRHLAVTDPAEMARHAMGNIPGWEHFPEQVQAGDILVVGENFGAGSSRQQAVDCLIALGVSAIIGASFSTIYERNAVNAGLPLLNGDLREKMKTGDPIRLDLERGLIERLTDGECLKVEPLPEVSMRIYRRGGLLAARG